jgi:hypothetical protein
MKSIFSFLFNNITIKQFEFGVGNVIGGGGADHTYNCL